MKARRERDLGIVIAYLDVALSLDKSWQYLMVGPHGNHLDRRASQSSIDASHS